MGETRQARRLSDAASRHPAGRLAARHPLSRFGRLLRAFAQDRRGATAIEYAIIASLIFVVIVTSVTLFGSKTTGVMDKASDAVAGAING